MADRSVAWRMTLDSTGIVTGSRLAKTAMLDLERNGIAKARLGLAGLEKSAKDHPQAWQAAGAAAVGFGGAVALGFGMAGRAAMQWQSDWAGVTKTVDGTEKQMSALESGLRNLARKELPASTTEIAAVAEAAGQLGIKTGNVLMFTKTMIDMGESTNLSAEEAASSLARFSNIMGTNQKDVGRLGAAVVGLGNNFATTEREIVEMAMRIAGAGRQAGMTEGDVLGLAAALSSVGIDAEAGGTAISMVMKKIGDEVSGGGDKLDTFAKTAGMSSDQFSAAWRDNASGALQTFIAGLGEAQANGENVNGTLTQLGITGIRESDALLRLSGASDVLKQALATGNEEYARGIALMEEANKRYDTAESRVRIAGNAIKDSAISFGDVFLPAVAGAADGVAGFANWISDLPQPVQQAAAGIGGLAGAAGLAGGGFLLLAPKVFDVIDGFKTLNREHPQVAGGLSSMSKAIAVVGAAFAAAQLTGAAFTAVLKQGTTTSAEMTAALVQLQNPEKTGVKDTILDPKMWENTQGFWSSTGDEINNWGDALERTTAAGAGFTVWMDKLTNTQSDISKANENIEATDKALSDLVSSGGLETAQQGFAAIADEAKRSDVDLQTTFEKFPQYRDHLTNIALAAGQATDDQTLMKIATGEITPEMLAAGAASDEQAQKLTELGVQAQSTGDKISELAEEIRGFGSATLSEREAQRAFQESLDTATEALEKNGKTLDITTQKGRDNQDALDGIAQSANEAAASMAENGASAEQLRSSLQTSREELVRTARSFGMTKSEAEAYADQVLMTPEEVRTRVKALGIDAALDGITSVQEALDKVKDKNVWVKVNEVYVRQEGNEKVYSSDPKNSGVQKFKADGGILEYMATGGLRPMSPIAEMVPPNTWRVVGDRMDVDEAYVPLDGSRRSWKILAEALQRMPGALPMAKGGIASAQRRVDLASDDLKTARRAKQDAKSKSAKAAAAKRVRVAEDALATAKKQLTASKDESKAAEQAAKLAKERAKEERERQARIGELRTDLRTDLRRGDVRQQVTGGLSGAYSAVDRLQALADNKDLSGGARRRAGIDARQYEKSLKSLYGSLEKLEERTTKAKDKLDELKQIQNSVSSSIQNKAYTLDVDSQWAQNKAGVWQQTQGVSGVRTNAAAAAKRVRDLSDKLKRLQRMGYSGAILQEVAQAGSIDESITMADELLKGTGSDVRSINASYKDIAKYADQAGAYVTEGFYKGGVNAAAGLVKGLESQQKAVEKTIERIARGMENSLKRALGIKSPSTVMYARGLDTAAGLNNALIDSLATIEDTAAQLGLAAVPPLTGLGPIPLDVAATTDTSALASGPVAAAAVPAPTDLAGSQAGAEVSWDDTVATTTDALTSMQALTAAAYLQMTADTDASLTARQESTLTAMTAMSETQSANLVAMSTNQASSLQAMTANHWSNLTTMAGDQARNLSSMATTQRDGWRAMNDQTAASVAWMRSGVDSTMRGMDRDVSGRLGELERTTDSGFSSISRSGRDSFEGMRAGIDRTMGRTPGDVGDSLNRTISVLGGFASAVNAAFAEVGVKLKAPAKLKYADGGTLPGYSPGQDIHQFYSPTGGRIDLSGGEAFMVPEWTKAMGGEAGIKAQNRAAREGRLDDLYEMQAEHFADGGVWRGLWGIVKSKFPSATLNSAYRGGARTVSGNSSYHSRGMAVDLGGPMRQIFDFLYNNYRNSNEIIYSPAGGRQIKNGRPYTYSGAVRKIHWNHVHWANRAVPGGAGADMTPGAFTGGDEFMPPSHPFLERANVDPGANLEKAYRRAAQKLSTDIYGKFAPKLPAGLAGQMGRGIMSRAAEGLVKKAAEFGKSQTFVMPGGSGVERWRDTVIQALKRVGLPTTDDYVNAWLRQIKSESGGNPNIRQQVRDVNSGGNEAMGLVQVIPGTFAAFRDKSLPNDRTHPLANLVAGMNWAKYRYKGRMLSVIGKGHGYAGGTLDAYPGLAEVGEDGFELVRDRYGKWARLGADGAKVVNFAGGEQVMPHQQSVAIENQVMRGAPSTIGLDDASVKAIAAAAAGQLTKADIAGLLDGVQITVSVDGQQMTGFVHSAVASGYTDAKRTIARSSTLLGS
ncbi:phage tail tape measure protein [Brevibacterium casei]|uniref:phage tail tape measure protein n=1 Tax=Brevibacterium casei TaxID=33889 RepID=UPI003F7DD467